MDAVEAPHGALGRGPIAEDHVQRRAQRAAQSPEGVGREVAVRGHPLGDERMGDLQQERRRPGAEQHGLAVDAPHLVSGP